MLTGTLRSQIDQIWNAFWSGGVSNPLSVIEQITYLLFINRLDDLHTLEGNKARTLGKAMERRIFPEGEDPKAGTQIQSRMCWVFAPLAPSCFVSRSSAAPFAASPMS